MIGTREILGCLLMLVGLALIALVVMLALNRNIFEAMVLSLPATIVFRSGVGLVRMGTAARVAMKLNRQNQIDYRD